MHTNCSIFLFIFIAGVNGNPTTFVFSKIKNHWLALSATNSKSFLYLSVCGGVGDFAKYWTGYFDGSTTTNIGGDGFVLLIISSHIFHAKMGCGYSTNTRDELLALWAILSFTTSIGIPTLSVFGDSQVIIH